MGTPATDQITPLHVIILVPGIITATAIIKAAVAVIIEAAVAVIIEVAVAAIIAPAVPEEAILMANAAGVASGGGLIPMTHHNPNHPDNTTANHNLTEGIDLTIEASLDSQEDITAIDPALQIASIPGIP